MLNGQMRSSSLIGAALLFALALAGHAAALHIIDVRPYAVFQHVRAWRELREYPWSAAVLAIQTAVVAIVGWQMRAALIAMSRSVLPIVGWLIVAAVIGFSLAVPSESVARYGGEVLLAGSLAIVATLNLIAAVLSIPPGIVTRLSRWVSARITLAEDDAQIRPWDRALPIVAAIWIVVLSAAASYVVLERVPHIDDSVSNYFQARYFADGRLFAPAPPDSDSFQMDQTVVRDGRWFGYAFPAWPAVLAIFVRIGVPWLANPVLAGIFLLLGHAFVRHRLGRGTANVTTLLMAVSPWLLFVSAEFMAHPTTNVFVIGAALAFDRAVDRGPRWPLWAIAAGMATGALVLTRAIDAVLLVGGIGLAVIVERRLLRAIAPTVVTGVAAAAVAALMLPYNYFVTGDPMYPPHMAWSDGHWGPGVDRLGFGPDVGIRAWPNLDPLPGHGPADVILNANKNMFMANVDLFGWASGSLLFLAIALAYWRWRRGDYFMLALSISYVAGYSCYWFSGGPDLGPRYWYPLLLPMAAMTARGACLVAARLREHDAVPQPAARVALFVVLASVSAMTVMVPWRAVTKHYRYRGVSGEVRDLAASRHIDHAIVFVRSTFPREYQSAFNLNPATLDQPETIYARDLGAEHRARVLAHFPQRPVWIIGREREGMPLTVIAGPLPPGTNPE